MPLFLLIFEGGRKSASYEGLLGEWRKKLHLFLNSALYKAESQSSEVPLTDRFTPRK